MSRRMLYLVMAGLACAVGLMGRLGLQAADPSAASDLRKRAEENPTKLLVRGTTPASNPAVAPGKVRWHPSFAAAQAAAVRSGKPVLLFQMMGRLDQRFC